MLTCELKDLTLRADLGEALPVAPPSAVRREEVPWPRAPPPPEGLESLVLEYLLYHDASDVPWGLHRQFRPDLRGKNAREKKEREGKEGKGRKGKERKGRKGKEWRAVMRVSKRNEGEGNGRGGRCACVRACVRVCVRVLSPLFHLDAPGSPDGPASYLASL